MVQKETKTSKSTLYLGAVFKYRLGNNTLENWQEKARKHLGSPKYNELMLRVSAHVQAGMRVIEREYMATGQEFEEDREALIMAVRGDVEDSPVQREA